MLLALETSDRNCAACLMDPATGVVVSSKTLDLGRGHAEKMMDVIAEVLAEAGKDYAALTVLAVCVGPGSFTGIRVALATATGLSIALGIHVIGVTALQALALNGSELADRLRREGSVIDMRIVATIDAHRGDVYIQVFNGELTPITAPRQIAVRAAFEEVRELKNVTVGNFGNGFPLLWQEWEAELKARELGHLDINTPDVIAGLNKRSADLPKVEAIARAALNPAMTVPAKPLYLRKPDAKPQESYTQARALRQ